MAVKDSVAEPPILGEILEYRGSGVYHIRSTTYPDVTYITDIENETCSCPATIKMCIHQRLCRIRAARVRMMVRELDRSCAACGTTEAKTLHPVPSDNLTFFEGDELCTPCARAHGVA